MKTIKVDSVIRKISKMGQEKNVLVISFSDEALNFFDFDENIEIKKMKFSFRDDNLKKKMGEIFHQIAKSNQKTYFFITCSCPDCRNVSKDELYLEFLYQDKFLKGRTYIFFDLDEHSATLFFILRNGKIKEYKLIT